MEYQELKKQLQENIESVISHLFPNAKKEGNRYKVGSINGEEGDSLVIETTSGKEGLWSDFSSSGDDKGSIVWLFVRKFGGVKEGYEEIYKFLNIEDQFEKYKELDHSSYDRPKVDWGKRPITRVIKYLEGRGIKKETMIDFKIRSASKFFPKASRELVSYVFPYIDDNNNLCNAKYVALDRDPKGKKYEVSSRNGKHSLFGMNLVFDMIKSEGDLSLVICEGEIDCMSVYQCGFPSVSVPFGCGSTNWIDSCWNFLSMFNNIIIAFDSDQAGRDAIKKISGRLGLSKCKVVEFPEGEDANSVLQKEDGPDLLSSLIENADFARHDKIADARTMVQLTVKSFKEGRREDKGEDWNGWTGRDSINWKVRPSEMTIHCGYPGGAKTTSLLQGMAYYTLVKNHKCAIASTEQIPKSLLETMTYQAIGRNLDKDDEEDIKIFESTATLLAERSYMYDFRGIARIDDLMDFARYCCKVKGVQHFILDSLTNSDVDLEDGKNVSQFLNRAVEFMVETGVHFHLVAHVRKGNQMDIRDIPRFDAVKGTNAFGALTTNCVTWWRNYRKEEHLKIFDLYNKIHDDKGRTRSEVDSMWGDSLCLISKQKEGGQVGKYPLWYNRDNYKFSRDSNRPQDSYIDIRDGRVYAEYDEENIDEPF